MTRYEQIRRMSDKEMAEFICAISSGSGCAECIASDCCGFEHNGMDERLREEGEIDELY